jgi:hypothetical protein
LYKNRNISGVEILQIHKDDRETSTVTEIIRYFLNKLSDSKHSFFMDKYYGNLEVIELLQEYEHCRVLACKPNKFTSLFESGLYNGKYINNNINN